MDEAIEIDRVVFDRYADVFVGCDGWDYRIVIYERGAVIIDCPTFRRFEGEMV